MIGPLVVEKISNARVGPVDLVVAAGHCAAISGPSGAGKSVLLRMIADLDDNDGDVRLGSMRRATVPAPLWRRNAIYLAAEAGWWAHTAEEHVPLDARPVAEVLAQALGLAEDATRRTVRSLSTGERQRLALVRALVRRPSALLLDEPTSGLDPAAVALVEALLKERLAAGLVVVLVTHDAAQAERLADARYTMDAGHLAPFAS